MKIPVNISEEAGSSVILVTVMLPTVGFCSSTFYYCKYEGSFLCSTTYSPLYLMKSLSLFWLFFSPLFNVLKINEVFSFLEHISA